MGVCYQLRAEAEQLDLRRLRARWVDPDRVEISGLAGDLVGTLPGALAGSFRQWFMVDWSDLSWLQTFGWQLTEVVQAIRESLAEVAPEVGLAVQSRADNVRELRVRLPGGLAGEDPGLPMNTARVLLERARARGETEPLELRLAIAAAHDLARWRHDGTLREPWDPAADALQRVGLSLAGGVGCLDGTPSARGGGPWLLWASRGLPSQLRRCTPMDGGWCCGGREPMRVQGAGA